jgi:DNA-binding NarL/FixJ family response regulator
MKHINLAIIEDDPIVLESLITFFGQISNINVCYTFSSVELCISTWENLECVQADIMLLDIQLPGKSGIEGIPEIKRIVPDLNIIILTTFEESDKIFDALSAGACSYLTKRSSLSTIHDCVKTVALGGSYMSPAIARKVVQFFDRPKLISPLTSRQTEIVSCIVDGLSYKMVGAKLNISIDTVRTHIMQIYRSLNINSKGELIKWAISRDKI